VFPSVEECPEFKSLCWYQILLEHCGEELLTLLVFTEKS
jgi:hypothetical protein